MEFAVAIAAFQDPREGAVSSLRIASGGLRPAQPLSSNFAEFRRVVSSVMCVRQSVTSLAFT
jgi:hypothetical protein